jgi:Tfp pilus assembly protein PilX
MTGKHHNSEQGVALVFTLFLMAALSALAVSLMFLAQTETASTRNYRTMSQARYAGEAGIHKAINYLVNTYPVPATIPTGFDATKSPVEYGGSPVVLSAITGVSSNYPDSGIVAAFNTAAQGSLAVGSGTVNYKATATLLSIREVTVYGGGNYLIQTWQLAAEGTVPGPMPATVEVTAMLERNFVQADTYAVFATGNGCGAITLAGNVDTDSYDSTTMASTPPATDPSGGAVGTNGNLNISGSVAVKGNLDTPRTGVGACNAGTPTALTGSGSASVNGSVVQLPQAKVYPPPNLPSPMPPIGPQPITAAGCVAILAANSGASCFGFGSNITIITNGSTPLLLGDVTLSAGTNLTISYGSSGTPATGIAFINANSVTMTGSSSITIYAPTPTVPGSVMTSLVMNVAGKTATGDLATPIDFAGGTIANATYDPSKFQILYAGSGTVKVTGGAAASATVYAPNADIVKHGSGGFYGSILGRTFTDQAGSNSSVHYDRSLASKYFTLGNYVMTSFSWKKY